MKNKQKGFVTPLVITIIVLLIIGSGIYVYLNKKSIDTSSVVCTMDAKLCPDGSYVGRIPPNCEFTPCPLNEKKAEFNKSVVLNLNDEIIFIDGLSITLKEINDSRCPANVQCIWQGEISALFDIKIDNISEEIHLGTVNSKKVIWKNYTFALESAIESSVTIIVQKPII